MSRVIAIANQKGGVGKTTTAINLSSALSHLGKKVLLLDIDPQGNSGRGVGIDISLCKETTFEVLVGASTLEETILKTNEDNLFVCPSNLRLASLEASLIGQGVSDPFFLLKRQLDQIKEQYDYVVIDCPPSLGALSLNALASCDSVIIPVQCEYFAMEAVAAILSSISTVQKKYNPSLEIEGFLLTMYDARTQLGTEISSEVRRLFKENTFLVSIPRNQSIADSQAAMTSVINYKPTSMGATAYYSLAREVIDHEKRR